jgi:hypothetical protein
MVKRDADYTNGDGRCPRRWYRFIDSVGSGNVRSIPSMGTFSMAWDLKWSRPVSTRSLWLHTKKLNDEGDIVYMACTRTEPYLCWTPATPCLGRSARNRRSGPSMWMSHTIWWLVIIKDMPERVRAGLQERNKQHTVVEPFLTYRWHCL